MKTKTEQPAAYVSNERSPSGTWTVRVEFPGHISHYSAVEHAMADIVLFGCRAVYV